MKCSCNCEPGEKPEWVVLKRHYSKSAFNGYRVRYSDYSFIRCRTCGHVWRTKAKYVESLPDATQKDYNG